MLNSSPHKRKDLSSALLASAIVLVPQSASSFYNSYEHYSPYNCNYSPTSVPPLVSCDIPTGNDGRKPSWLSWCDRLHRYFEGDVFVCISDLSGAHGVPCDSKYLFEGGSVNFRKPDGDLEFELPSPWWNWVMYIQFWDVEPPTTGTSTRSWTTC